MKQDPAKCKGSAFEHLPQFLLPLAGKAVHGPGVLGIGIAFRRTAVPEDQHVPFLQRKLILAGKFFQTAVLHETDHPEPQQLFRQFLKRKYRQFLRRFRLCRRSCFRFEFHLAADMPLDTAVQRLL